MTAPKLVTYLAAIAFTTASLTPAVTSRGLPSNELDFLHRDPPVDDDKLSTFNNVIVEAEDADGREEAVVYLPMSVATEALLAALRAHQRFSEARRGVASQWEQNRHAPSNPGRGTVGFRDRYPADGSPDSGSMAAFAGPAGSPSLTGPVSAGRSSGGIKRKMFWQPLGYMSASARRHNNNNNNNKANNNGRHRGTSSDTGSSVFRYG